MTQEDKELLFKDLCGRLPYGIIVDYKDDEYDFHHWKISTLHALSYSQSGSLINTDSDGWIGYDEYKGCGMSSGSRPLHIEKNLPFLRSMSSMTEEEKQNLLNLLFDKEAKHFYIDDEGVIDGKTSYLIKEGLNYPAFCPINVNLYTDWLNANHFDYRGLISKGLAIEAPKDMYK